MEAPGSSLGPSMRVRNHPRGSASWDTFEGRRQLENAPPGMTGWLVSSNLTPLTTMGGKTTINPKLSDWLTKDTKRQNDMEVNRLVVPSFIQKGNAQCLSFPASDWKYESDLAQSNLDVWFTFHGVELNREVFKRSMERAAHLNKEHGNSEFLLPTRPYNLREFIGESRSLWPEEERYDLVYPDWMGTWSQDKKEQVRRMFTRQIFSCQSYLAVTIMLARGTLYTFADLKLYQAQVSERIIETLVLNDRTVEAMEGSKTGRLKASGVSGYVIKMAGDAGYTAELIRLSVYDSCSNIRKGIVTPEMSLLYSITRS